MIRKNGTQVSYSIMKLLAFIIFDLRAKKPLSAFFNHQVEPSQKIEQAHVVYDQNHLFGLGLILIRKLRIWQHFWRKKNQGRKNGEKFRFRQKKVTPPKPKPKLDLGFSCRYRNQVLVVHH